jgi:N-acetylmuramic acid 6-phosphate etherase
MTNKKLVDRAERILMEVLSIDNKTAVNLLEKHKSIRSAIKHYK